jgi:hypothetical protein
MLICIPKNSLMVQSPHVLPYSSGSIPCSIRFGTIRAQKNWLRLDRNSRSNNAHGTLWYVEPNTIGNAISYAKRYSRSHDAVMRVYDDAGNVIETHEHNGDFKDWLVSFA